MSAETRKALGLIIELTEAIGERADPLWAWWAVHDIASHALGMADVSEKGLQWAITRAKELGLIQQDDKSSE